MSRPPSHHGKSCNINYGIRNPRETQQKFSPHSQAIFSLLLSRTVCFKQIRYRKPGTRRYRSTKKEAFASPAQTPRPSAVACPQKKMGILITMGAWTRNKLGGVRPSSPVLLAPLKSNNNQISRNLSCHRSGLQTPKKDEKRACGGERALQATIFFVLFVAPFSFFLLRCRGLVAGK